MKKIILFVAILVIISSAGVFAGGFDFGVGSGFSYAFLPENTYLSYYDSEFEAVYRISAGMRYTLNMQFLYHITELIGLGANAGLYCGLGFNMDAYDFTDVIVPLIDLPLHAVARFSFSEFAIDAFGGYYFSLLNKSLYDFGGFEVGGKFLIGKFYISGSEVFARDPYFRLELGMEF